MRVLITDSGAGNSDGPTYEFANRPLYASWVRPGGDWLDASGVPYGAAHYAVSAPIPDYTQGRDITLDVAALVTRLLTENTGIYVAMASGLAKFASRTHGTFPGPRLRVVTTAGTYDAPCIVDTNMEPTSNQPQGALPDLSPAFLLKFDLSAITGTVTSAVLTIAVSNVYVPGGALTADYLDPPDLDAWRAGAVQQGVAATVAKDADLADHSAVLIYDDIVSSDYILKHFQGIPPALPRPETNCEFIAAPEYGLTMARCWAIVANQRLISWHHWTVPKQVPPQDWQWDFPNGPTHLFFRFLMRIGEDVKVGMTEQGMKLPGLSGTYDWSTSGAPTSPIPDDPDLFSARLWHSPVSLANPDVYHLATYLYGGDHPIGGNDYAGIPFASAYLRAGRIYSIEQEIKLNTITGDVANADGEMRLWVDGILAYEQVGAKIRGNNEAVRIQDAPWLNIYHGGTGLPSAPFHYDIGGIVIADRYIGPPKLLTGVVPMETVDVSYDPTKVSITLNASNDSSLQQQLDAANATIVTLNGKIDKARIAAQKDKAADAATVTGQGVLDALA